MVSSMIFLPSILKQTCPICPIRNMTFWVSLIEYLEYKRFVNSERSLSDCIRPEIHSKVVFVVTSGCTFYNLGTFWVLTNWRRCRGRKCISAPGERQGLREISVGKQGLRKQKEVVYLPWRLHCEIIQNSRTTFWLQEDIHEVTLIPKFWKVLKIQKDRLKRRIKKS